MSAIVGSLAILGSTGSIGRSTLEVVRLNRESLSVVALSGYSNIELLIAQANEFKPRYVVAGSEEAADRLRSALDYPAEVMMGERSLEQVVGADEVHTVVAAVVGFAGFRSVLAAIKQGKNVALANKESLVAGGEVLKQALSGSVSRIVPVDSEHSSLYQCFQSGRGEDIAKVTITASGGPFLHTPLEELRVARAADAVKHPRWKMGAKISVDSATLMNKGLEVIEAAWLFDLPSSSIEVIVHPQSIIHGLVHFTDGTVMACLAEPDMRLPIAYALSCLCDTRFLGGTERIARDVARLSSGIPFVDLCSTGRLDFIRVDEVRFPAIQLAFDALQLGGGAEAVLNAANEVAVEAYLAETIGFLDVTRTAQEVLEGYSVRPMVSVDDIIETDRWGRERARKIIASR